MKAGFRTDSTQSLKEEKELKEKAKEQAKKQKEKDKKDEL